MNGGYRVLDIGIIMRSRIRKAVDFGSFGPAITVTRHQHDGFYTVSFNRLRMEYCELQVTSNFSFLRGASHPEELVEESIACQHSAIAITDRNTLAGIVRAHKMARKYERM